MERYLARVAKFTPPEFKHKTTGKQAHLDEYVYQKYGILPGDAKMAGMLAGIASSIALMVTLKFLGFKFLTIALGSVGFGSGVGYTCSSWAYRQARREKKRHDVVANLVYEDFLTLLSAFESTKDSFPFFIYSIARSNYPVSKAFQEALQSIMGGHSPEKALDSIQTPSKVLKRVLHECLTLWATNSDEPVKSRFSEQEHEFSQFTKSLESRINFTFFVSVFFPLGVVYNQVLGVMGGLATSLLAPAAFLLLVLVVHRLFLSDASALAVMVLARGENADGDELKEMISFLSELTVFTAQYSPERAIWECLATQKRGDVDEKLRRKILNDVARNSYGLEEAFLALNEAFPTLQARLIFNALHRTCQRDSSALPSKIRAILKYLTIQDELNQDRRDVLKSEKFRAALFTILVPLILGILGGVVPAFTSSSFSTVNAGWSSTVLTWTTFLEFLAMTLISTHFMTKTIAGSVGWFNMFFSATMYSLTYWLVAVVL
ncbi:MAG: hypothetical protein Kow0069_02010 [Promethearchaeota archaeon]